MILPSSILAEGDEKEVFHKFGIRETYKILDVAGDGNCIIYVTLVILAMENERGVFQEKLGQNREYPALDYVIQFRTEMNQYITKTKMLELKEQLEMFQNKRVSKENDKDFIYGFRGLITGWAGMKKREKSDFGNRTIDKATLSNQLQVFDTNRTSAEGLTDEDRLCLVDAEQFVYIFDQYLKKHHPVRLVVICSSPFSCCDSIRVCETTAVNQWKVYHLPFEELTTRCEDGIKTYAVIYHDDHYTLFCKKRDGVDMFK